MTPLLLVVGLLLLSVSAGAIYVPAGGLVAGCACVALAIGLTRAGGDSE